MSGSKTFGLDVGLQVISTRKTNNSFISMRQSNVWATISDHLNEIALNFPARQNDIPTAATP